MLSTFGLFVLIVAAVGGGLLRYSANRGLQLRLIAGFGVLLLIMIGLCVISYTSLTKIARENEAVAHDDVPLLVQITDVEKAILLESLQLERFANSRDEMLLRRYHQLNEEVETEADQIEQLLEDAVKRAHTAQGRDEMRALRNGFLEVLDEYADFEETGQRLITAIQGNQVKIVHDLKELLGEEEEHMVEALARAVEEVESIAIREAKGAASQATSTEMVVLIVCVLSVLAGVALAIFLGRSITGPIRMVITGLRSGSDQVSSASEQLASSSQQMSEGASEQASSLEEVSSSLEEMASMTKQNADNAKQANAMASEASSASLQGSQAMKQMGEAVDRIKTSAEETAKIVKTIDEIAMQTNLLALNAAVEAARAGEAGRGFAVVAEEVRNLAQRSAEAAKTTANLIEESQRNSENGVTSSEEVGKTLKRVTGKIQEVAQLISEVSTASEEQSQGIDQVNAAVAQMDRVTQGNAASAEESASASEELSSQAQALNGMVIDLVKIVGEGGNGGTSLGSGVAMASRWGGRSSKQSMSEHIHGMLHHDEKETGHMRKTSRVKKRPAVHDSDSSPERVIPLNDDEEFRDF